MTKTAIITDSDSSLPQTLAKEFGIQQVPITIHFGEESYTCGLDIDDAKVFELVNRKNQLPTTAAPSPGAFVSAFQRAFDDGADAIVCICVSSKVSATYNSALSACVEFPDKHIIVVDSKTLSMGQGFMALAAAKAAQASLSPVDIARAAEDIGSRLHVFAVLPTLKYVAMSGRVGKFVAGMADTLNIMPILSVKDGKLELLERIRTHKKAIERMLELVRIAVNGKKIESVAYIHVDNLKGLRELEEQFCSQHAYVGDSIDADFTPGLSVHAGPGVVGLVVLVES